MFKRGNEDGDANSGARENVRPRKVFTNLARLTGVLKAGEDLSEAQWDLIQGVVDLCATHADDHLDWEKPKHTVGDHIREMYYRP